VEEKRDYDVFKLKIGANNTIESLRITYDNHEKPGPEARVAEDQRLRESIDRSIAALKAGELDGRQAEIKRLGSDLYCAIFPDKVGSFFEDALNAMLDDRSANPSRWLRIIIEVHPRSDVFGWPLEFLYCERKELWLATERPFLALSRHLAFEGNFDLSPQRRPLRALVVISNPGGLAGVITTRVLEEIGKLADSASQRGEEPGMEVQVLGQVEAYERQIPGITYQDQPAEYPILKDLIPDWKPHVVHFIGHGKLDGIEGSLALTKDNQVDWTPADDISQLFSAWQPRLVLLQACESALSGTEPAFMSLADRIFKRNIPAVVAMQFQITNDYASQFAQGFYAALRDGKDVDEAVQVGRAKITNQVRWKNRDFGAPVLFTYRPDAIMQPLSRVGPKLPGLILGDALKLSATQRVLGKLQQALKCLEEGTAQLAEEKAELAEASAKRAIAWIDDVLRGKFEVDQIVRGWLSDARECLASCELEDAKQRLNTALDCLATGPTLAPSGQGKTLPAGPGRMLDQASAGERTLS